MKGGELRFIFSSEPEAEWSHRAFTRAVLAQHGELGRRTPLDDRSELVRYIYEQRKHLVKN